MTAKENTAVASSWWLDRLSVAPSVVSLTELVALGGDVSARGASGSSTVLIAGLLARNAPGPILLVVPHLDDADEAVDELTEFGIDAASFPALEVMPGESDASLDLVGHDSGCFAASSRRNRPASSSHPSRASCRAFPRRWICPTGCG